MRAEENRSGDGVDLTGSIRYDPAIRKQGVVIARAAITSTEGLR